jgi:hypothetical protein
MAAPANNGRFTPKGGSAGVNDAKSKAKAAENLGGASAADDVPAYARSGRYTPPVPRSEIAAMQETKPWVPWVAGFFGIAGLLSIILNYFSLLPGGANNWYLMGGLVGITLAFITLTQLK